MKLEPGAHVTANVQLLRPLGEGGMGAVWVARHLALDTEVAVKFLLGDFVSDPSARARFSQEAAAASQVKSSHVVKIYDYGVTDSDTPFIVMELLEGTDLAQRIDTEGKLKPTDVVDIVSQLCKALERAHALGVIHRDVKPQNVFLTQEGGDVFVKLLDFGIAKNTSVHALSVTSRRSTLAGESLGTPFYMSPEQFKSAKTIDLRSDLWSVGVLTYEALTGQLPFVAETVGALAIVVNEGVATPPSTVEPSLPRAFDAWFAKACATAPAARFASARELVDSLRAAFGAAPIPVDSASYRRVVISQVDAAELADAERLSMRDTSFATSGGSAAARPRKRGVVGVAVAVAASVAVVGAAIVALRAKSTSAPATSAAATSVDAARPSPIVPPSVAAAPSALARPLAATAADASASSSQHATTAPTTRHASHATGTHAHPASSATATTKETHGDIW